MTARRDNHTMRLDGKQVKDLTLIVYQYAGRAASVCEGVDASAYAALVSGSYRTMMRRCIEYQHADTPGYLWFCGADRESLFAVLDYARNEALRDGYFPVRSAVERLLRAYRRSMIGNSVPPRARPGPRTERSAQH